MKKPNILYLHSHDTGRYVQPYGYAVPTPNIQRLAEQGVLFRQAFCAAPTCSPSRAALLTGQCAHSSGMLGLAHKGWALDRRGEHIVHTLRTAGYESTLIGFQHVADWDHADRIGYDRVIRPVQRAHADQVIPAAVKFLKGSPKQPFFLSVGVVETHRFGLFFSPAGPQGDPRYCRPPDPIPDTPETRRDMADFAEAARLLDEGYGSVLKALDKTGLAENTLVVCTTDHGVPFPMMKCNLTDHGIGVMLIMRGPGGFAGGKVLDSLVSQIDIFPTLCDLTGAPPPAWLQGRSMMPLIREDRDEIRSEVFAEVTYHAEYEPQRAVRTQRWKYIRRFDAPVDPVLGNCDGGRSKEFLVDHGWPKHAGAEEQLYDVLLDPHEAHNLATDPAHGPALAQMRSRLGDWLRDTDDPLLRGPVAGRTHVPDTATVEGERPVRPDGDSDL